MYALASFSKPLSIRAHSNVNVLEAILPILPRNRPLPRKTSSPLAVVPDNRIQNGRNDISSCSVYALGMLCGATSMSNITGVCISICPHILLSLLYIYRFEFSSVPVITLCEMKMWRNKTKENVSTSRCWTKRWLKRTNRMDECERSSSAVV